MDSLYDRCIQIQPLVCCPVAEFHNLEDRTFYICQDKEWTYTNDCSLDDFTFARDIREILIRKDL